MSNLGIVRNCIVLALSISVVLLCSACGGGGGGGKPTGGGKPKGSTPEFSTATTATFTAGRSGSFDMSASGSATKITESGTLPSGLSFESSGNGSASISGTPANGTGGQYSLSLIAADSAGQTTQQVTLTVDQAPAFTKSDNTNMYLAPFKYDNTPITTTGYPPAKLVEVGTLPHGLKFKTLGNGKALISGRPGIEFAISTPSITIVAQNPAGMAQLKINITGA